MLLLFCVYTCAFSTTHVYTPHIHSSKSTPLLDYALTVVLKQSLLAHSSYTHSQLYCLSLYIIKHFPIHPSCVKNTNWRAETKPLAQHNNYVVLSPHSICVEVLCVYSCFHGPRPRYSVSFSLLFLLFLLIISIFCLTQSYTQSLQMESKGSTP